MFDYCNIELQNEQLKKIKLITQLIITNQRYISMSTKTDNYIL